MDEQKLQEFLGRALVDLGGERPEEQKEKEDRTPI